MLPIIPGVVEHLGMRESISEQTTGPAGDTGFIDEPTMLARLPISRRSLFDLRKSGKIPFIRLPGGRRILFHWESVQQALLRLQRGGNQ
jgi:hypothetical protein